MKYAFLILCHKNSKQINMLLDSISKFSCEIFIHIDKKSYTKLINEIEHKENIHFLEFEDCYDIKWGGIEMINATLSLIRSVLKSEIEFDYLWLLSGQDYRIRNYSEIDSFIKKNNGNNFIEIINKDDKEYNNHNKYYEIKYYPCMTNDNFIAKVLKRVYMIATGGFTYSFKFFRRKKPINGDFYFGSQWWTITLDFAKYIIDYTNSNPNYIEYFKNTIIPDECFFQTLFMNSEFKNKRLNNLTFVNWGKNRRSPETITINDYEKILHSKRFYAFARKFDIDVDEEIIKKIKKNTK